MTLDRTTDDVIAFRPLTRDDFAQVSVWLRAPHVSRWWSDLGDPASIEARYGPRLDGDVRTEMFVICYRGEPIGVIQRYRLADHVEWSETIRATGVGVERAAGVDYMIGVVDVTGRGVGSTAIDRFTDLLFLDYSDISVVLAAPQQENVPSWRALEKAGYTRVWDGTLDSDNPSDVGPAFLYRRSRD